MTAQTRTTNKAAFQQGDKPQGTDYVDLIDSFVALQDTTAQSLLSDLSVVTLIASTEVSSPSGRFGALRVSASSRFDDAVTIGGAQTVSGAATFAGAIAVSGSSSFAGQHHVSGSTQFFGPVRGGASSFLTHTQIVTVASENSGGNPVTINLGGNADLIEFYVDTVIPPAAGALATAANLEIGVSGSNAYFAAVPCSATGTRRLGSSFVTGTIKRWTGYRSGSPDASGTIRAHLTVQSLATALTVGEVLLRVLWVRRD